MLRFFRRKKERAKQADDPYLSAEDAMCKLYKSKLLPLEEAYKFHEFHSPALQDADFQSKPMVLLVGQYSTGKTTFIKYLLESEFPGIHIGPGPTTERFIVVMHGENENIVEGNAVATNNQLPFETLSQFGNGFLQRFQCSTLNNYVLKSLSFIDTPGILSSQREQHSRGYETKAVIKWFAARVDRIVLLFDAQKQHISDELREVLEVIKDYESKLHIVLNKSCSVNSQELMRVYGAVMWNLGKVMSKTEVSRVYIGSFWDEDMKFETNKELFELERDDLFSELLSLQHYSVDRKLNDLIKRARLAKIHAFIISKLGGKMPSLLRKDEARAKLISELDRVFSTVAAEQKINLNDFPDLKRMRETLQKFSTEEFKKFPQQVDEKLISNVEEMIGLDLANILKRSGVWFLDKYRYRYDKKFYEIKSDDADKVSVVQVYLVIKHFLVEKRLKDEDPGDAWELVDIDKDNYVNCDEFAIFMYCIEQCVNGTPIPKSLPDHLKPPQRH